MSENVRHLTPVIITLRSLKPKQRKVLVDYMNKEHMKGVTEVAINLIKSSVQLTPEQLKICRRWSTPTKQLALKRLPLKKKKEILQTGGFLGALLPVLASVLSTVFNG